jgi:CheY-like chemotaxis protein
VLDLRERPAGEPVRVVVVDDSVSVCKAIGRMLGPYGVEMVEMHSGEEALAGLQRDRPDLIICDLVLPDVEGLAICRFVRENRALSEVPLLAISGRATDELRGRATAAGVDALLQKPFSGDLLLAHVDALLGGPRRATGRRMPAVPQPPSAMMRLAAELESLEGLLAGSWQLAGGAEGHLRVTATGVAPPDPETMLARLRSFAAPLGVGAPELVLVEGDGGELLLIGHRDRGGIVCLHLAASAIVGKARYLARKFLRTVATDRQEKESSQCRP